MMPENYSDPTEWPWPDSLDSVTAAPDSHIVLLENSQVRVLEVVIPQGHKEPVHTHRHPSVMIIDGPAKIRYYDEDGNATDLLPERMDGITPRTERLKPEGPHAVENIDDKTYHAVRIELQSG